MFLQSQRNQTRLSARFMPETKRRPFDSYDQDELRKAMIALDGCNKALPPSFNKETQVATNTKAGRPGKNQDRILAALNKHGEMTTKEITDKIRIDRGLISVALSRMEKAGVVERRTNSAAGNLWAIKGAPEKREQEMISKILSHMEPGKEYTSGQLSYLTGYSSNVVARRLSKLKDKGLLTYRLHKKRYRWMRAK